MQRTACFGRCPEYTVELFKNGRIVYTGKKNVAVIGLSETTIEQATMSAFLKQVSKNKINTCKNVYKALASDLPRLNFTFMLNGKTKSIKNAESGPAYLVTIGRMVDSIVQSAQWESPAPDPIQVEEGPKINSEMPQPEVFTYVEQLPSFPGGDQAMLAFISKNIHYPSLAKENSIQGKVFCSFVVNENGKIEHIKVERGIGGGCDEEAIRVIRMMPDWRPGKQNGRAVAVRFTLPVKFSLE